MTYSLPGGPEPQAIGFEHFQTDHTDYSRNLILPGSQETARGPQADAIQDILDVVELRAATHFDVNFFRTRFGSNNAEVSAQVKREFLQAPTITERFEIFYDCVHAKAADLGMLRNNGKWLTEETRAIEKEITAIAEMFRATGMGDGMIDPTTSEADVRFHVLFGMTNVDDRVNLRHKRVMFKTRPHEVDLVDPLTGAESKAWRVVSVDKLAEHSLDLSVLDQMRARDDVTALLEAAVNGGGLMEVPQAAHSFVYRAIDDATDGRLVSRAATIYYVENKLLTHEEAQAYAITP